MIAVRSLTITPWPKYTYERGQGYKIIIPESKMPDCPECGNDELTFVQEKTIMCMSCHKWFIKHETIKRY